MGFSIPVSGTPKISQYAGISFQFPAIVTSIADTRRIKRSGKMEKYSRLQEFVLSDVAKSSKTRERKLSFTFITYSSFIITVSKSGFFRQLLPESGNDEEGSVKL